MELVVILLQEHYSKEYEESLKAQVPMSWETWTFLKQKIMRVSQMKREEVQWTRDPEFPIVMDCLDIRAIRTLLADRFPLALGYGKVFKPGKSDGYDLQLHKYPRC